LNESQVGVDVPERELNAWHNGPSLVFDRAKHGAGSQLGENKALDKQNY
jgi:hypothetical protein